MIWIFIYGLFFIACSSLTIEKENEETGTFDEIVDACIENIDSGEDVDTDDEEINLGEETDTGQWSMVRSLWKTIFLCVKVKYKAFSIL